MNAPSSLDELDSRFEAVVAAVQSQDRSLALNLAVRAVEAGLDEPLVLLLAAEFAAEHGDLELAHRQLEQAAELSPDQAEIWRRLGETRAAMGRLDQANDALSRALRLLPDFGPSLLAAAGVDFRQGRLSLAEARFERAAVLLPATATPLEGLAAIAVRKRHASKARTLAMRALQHRDVTVGARLTLCRADLLDGQAAAAHSGADQILADVDLPADARIAALDVRSEARDALDDTDGAFSDYTQRNRLIAEKAALDGATTEGVRRHALRITHFLASTPATRWREKPGVDWNGDLNTTGHVFLIGFPRSGTTLLEKMLASHPDVVTLEEVDHLGAAGADLLQDEAGLSRLLEITPAEANRRRLIYWDGVRRTTGAGSSSRVLIDKLPLHTLALPLIAKLFPTSRVLFALRDPRDVVFSCFRRRFAMNAAMYELLELNSAAAFYDAVMRLGREARHVLPLQMLDVRMEHMIQDFDRETSRVLEFIGLDWREQMRDFTNQIGDTARTPSDLQLLRGLDSAGIGQWRRYARHLAPVLPVLQPWVDVHRYS